MEVAVGGLAVIQTCSAVDGLLAWNQGWANTSAMVSRSSGFGRSSRWMRSRTSGEPCKSKQGVTPKTAHVAGH